MSRINLAFGAVLGLKSAFEFMISYRRDFETVSRSLTPSPGLSLASKELQSTLPATNNKVGYVINT